MNEERKKYCQECGTWIPGDSIHCPNCGSKLADGTENFSEEREFRRSEGRSRSGYQGNFQRKSRSRIQDLNEFNYGNDRRVQNDRAGSSRNVPRYRGAGQRAGKPFYKKWWFWVIIAVLLIGMIGAAGSDSDDQEDSADTKVEQVQSAPEESSGEEEIPNPLSQCEIVEADILSGDGQVIGKRAYIEYSEEDFNKLTDLQIADFVLENVISRDDSYFTIVFCNGRGIVFPECSRKDAQLGTIDDSGSIVTAEKTMTVTLLGKVKWKDAAAGSESSSVQDTASDGTSSDQSSTSSGTGDSTASDSTESAGVSIEYRNALKKAETYSSFMHMSKQGIYDQLTSEYGEQFSADAAQYAVDHVNADWNANALAKAKSYQESMSMSTSAIYDQLISEYGEQFTPEEAQYAIDHLG